jgi:hypothetical protein
MPRDMGKQVTQYSKYANLLEEFEWMYQEQKSRFQAGREMEKKIGFLSTTMGRELESLKRLALDIMKVRKQLGIPADGGGSNAGIATKIDFDNIYGRKGYNDIMADPKRRLRVFNAFERIVAISSMETEEDKLEAMEAEHGASSSVIDADAEEIESTDVDVDIKDVIASQEKSAEPVEEVLYENPDLKV